MSRQADRDAAVSAQYEAYPYPARDPAEEVKRLIAGSPSRLAEIRHHLFAGRLPCPFRALFAGGGTGDGLVMLAQQLTDAGHPFELVHLDLSEAAQDIARRRIAARGLENVRFVRGPLEDAVALTGGGFHYADCCGVLHHLETPEDGLRALAAAVRPDGGMGLMVYAPHGRAGVYEMQAALRAITAIDEEPSRRVDIARRVLKQAPATNGLRRNPLVGDHLQGGDAGLYDLLLHPRDRAYTVMELDALCAAAEQRIISFIEPVRYRPETYLNDPEILRRLKTLSMLEQAAFVERLTGNMRKHVIYTAPAGRAEPVSATPETTGLVPVLEDAPPAAWAKAARAGFIEGGFDGLKLRFPLPSSAPAVLERCDGARTLAAIAEEVAAARRLSPDQANRAVAETASIMTGLGKLFLREVAAA